MLTPLRHLKLTLILCGSMLAAACGPSKRELALEAELARARAQIEEASRIATLHTQDEANTLNALLANLETAIRDFKVCDLIALTTASQTLKTNDGKSLGQAIFDVARGTAIFIQRESALKEASEKVRNAEDKLRQSESRLVEILPLAKPAPSRRISQAEVAYYQIILKETESAIEWNKADIDKAHIERKSVLSLNFEVRKSLTDQAAEVKKRIVQYTESIPPRN